MEKISVVFNRPLKLGKHMFPKGRRPVEIDAELLESSFAKVAQKEGWMMVSAPIKAESKQAAAAPASKDKK